MKSAIRCCISCILPCGSLDVIRIVHANGRVEEISSGSIKASDIMDAYPKHILKKPSTYYCSFEQENHGISPKILVVPPHAQLQRGKIYFLMPAPISKPEKARPRNKIKEVGVQVINSSNNNSSKVDVSSHQRDSRRRGRSAVWRPHLDSISETPIEAQ